MQEKSKSATMSPQVTETHVHPSHHVVILVLFEWFERAITLRCSIRVAGKLQPPSFPFPKRAPCGSVLETFGNALPKTLPEGRVFGSAFLNLLKRSLPFRERFRKRLGANAT